tara:strand:+ start:102 stop:284 length:183 start_codon:yes stop_codon:yes gene_type:complete
MSKLKAPTQKDYEHVELILKEADAYGLKLEVQAQAKRYIELEPSMEYVEAFIHAYNDWIK